MPLAYIAMANVLPCTCVVPSLEGMVSLSIKRDSSNLFTRMGANDEHILWMFNNVALRFKLLNA